MVEPIECQCDICRSYCESKPGWLAPGDAEVIAAHLGLTVQELFKQKLVVDYWSGEPDIYLLSPASDGNTSGELDNRFIADGRCVFFKDGLCTIHAVKPFECRSVDHRGINHVHKEVADKWVDHQDQIDKLLRGNNE